MDQYVKIHEHEKVLEKRKARQRDWLLGWGLQFSLEKLTGGFLIRFFSEQRTEGFEEIQCGDPWKHQGPRWKHA